MRDLTAEEQQLAYRFAYVALPPDAIACDPWDDHGGEYRRYFVTREWDVEGIWVSVGGEQNVFGETTRWLHVGGEDQCSSSDRGRLIWALTHAGALLDALNAGDLETSARLSRLDE